MAVQLPQPEGQHVGVQGALGGAGDGTSKAQQHPLSQPPAAFAFAADSRYQPWKGGCSPYEALDMVLVLVARDLRWATQLLGRCCLLKLMLADLSTV